MTTSTTKQQITHSALEAYEFAEGHYDGLDRSDEIRVRVKEALQYEPIHQLIHQKIRRTACVVSERICISRWPDMARDSGMASGMTF